MPHMRPTNLNDRVYAVLADAAESLPVSEIQYRLAGQISTHWVLIALGDLFAEGRVSKSVETFTKIIPKRTRDQVQVYRATVYTAIVPASKGPKAKAKRAK